MDDNATSTQPSDVSDAIATLIANLPAPVREFVNGPDRDRVALELMQKYDLHADQGGDFERAYIRMLLGVDTPDEFTASLRQAGISEASISGLTNDVNEMVFKPLRRKEQEAPVRATAPIPPPAPTPVRETPPAPVVPPPAPAPVAQPQPTYAPSAPGAHQQTYWVPVSITAVPQPYMTTEPPPLSYPQPTQAPLPSQPEPIAPPPKVEQREEPPPPPPLPQPTWRPEPPPNLPTYEESRTPLKKDYAADPYREPPV